MASLEDLKLALRETLETRGVLSQVKARIRAEIFNALDDQDDFRPQLSHENLLINELIREYLEYNKYRHTLAVLIPETGQPQEPLGRKFLAEKVGISDDANSRSVPLIYSILHALAPIPAPGVKASAALPDVSLPLKESSFDHVLLRGDAPHEDMPQPLSYTAR
eukprot:gnl/Spiro4/4697_TR2345_c0_g1_i1.p1 gnl/Spiro4/4697_TR2345_c0_g1~~gnl/Spiro4/4697_TR2345_c0_g1_i1.p1  ORF type:complete len:178 (+),score=35.05 gnl/Spiro4/4697_TR2345_c0_g1_i1:44-535(+)